MKQESPNKPSKVTTVAPNEKALPAGFGSQPKSGGMEETANYRKLDTAGARGSPTSSAAMSPDKQTMKFDQSLNGSGMKTVQRMGGGAPSANHALSGNLKISNRKMGSK